MSPETFYLFASLNDDVCHEDWKPRINLMKEALPKEHALEEAYESLEDKE